MSVKRTQFDFGEYGKLTLSRIMRGGDPIDDLIGIHIVNGSRQPKRGESPPVFVTLSDWAEIKAALAGRETHYLAEAVTDHEGIQPAYQMVFAKREHDITALAIGPDADRFIGDMTWAILLANEAADRLLAQIAVWEAISGEVK